jgi:excisionase family DNA binding protein
VNTIPREHFLPAPPREVMDIQQCAAYLGISADTLYKYAASGDVPAFKLGNRWRFKLSLVNRWMENQTNGTEQ